MKPRVPNVAHVFLDIRWEGREPVEFDSDDIDIHDLYASRGASWPLALFHAYCNTGKGTAEACTLANGESDLTTQHH